MTTIILSCIQFEGRHGATAFERRSIRRFEVDVEIRSPLDAAQTTDRIADTIDYRMIADVVIAIGTGEPHRLLESLARRMLDALAERAPAAGITLELRKLHPFAVPGNPAHTAVRLDRAPG